MMKSMYLDLTYFTYIEFISFSSPSALMIFRSQMKRDPEVSSRDSDLSKLCEIRDHILHEMKIESQIVENASFK